MYNNLIEMLSDIASAIRERTATSDKIVALDFPQRIRKIIVRIEEESNITDIESVQYDELKDLFHDIAEAIRYKEGSKGIIPAEAFAARIRALPFFEEEVLPITYQVVMAEGQSWPDGVNPQGTAEEIVAYRELVKSVFPKAVAFGNSYSFDVNAPAGYTARVFREYTYSTEPRKEFTGDKDVNEGYPLGTDVVYVWNSNGTAQGPAADSPSFFITNYEFYDENLSLEPILTVELTHKPKKIPVFNAVRITEFEGLKGRGSVGIDRGWNGAPAGGGNIDTVDNWNWTNNKTGVADIPLTEEPDGTYSYLWTFQTNSSWDMILDELSVNGYALRIPFMPETTSPEEDAEAAIGTPGTYAVTQLANGEEIHIRFIREFRSSVPQRVYTIKFSNFRGDIIITYANLTYFRSDTKCIVGPLIGICAQNDQLNEVEVYDSDWVTLPLFGPTKVLYQDNGDPLTYGANIRFKLMNGYENPSYDYSDSTTLDIVESSKEELDGDFGDNEKVDAIVPQSEYDKYLDNSNQFSKGHIYGPDEEGWYYIRIFTKTNNNLPITLLAIVADKIDLGA